MVSKLAAGTRLRQVVAGKLARRWSPKQIAVWLRATFADRPELQVSHETIYQAIYVQSRGSL
ncbi:IS30 family transposase, partial [Micromonospora chalcea]